MAGGEARSSATRSTPPRCARRSATARPDVVVNELTKLPRDYDTRNMDERFYAPTNRIRTEGGAATCSRRRARRAQSGS